MMQSFINHYVHDSATNWIIQYNIRPSDMKQAGCNSSFVNLKNHSGSAHHLL